MPRHGVTVGPKSPVSRNVGKGKRAWPFLDENDPRGLVALMRAFLEAQRLKGYSERSVATREWALSDFVLWCQARDLMRPTEITKPILERFQRMLFYARKENGQPLTLTTQHGRLSAIKLFFRWLTRGNYILSNPASELELPRVERRLPKHVLTAHEAEEVLAQPDIRRPIGIRDRALLETLYSTGVRRSELAHLKVTDLDLERGTLMVRQGKGRKDRLIPIGERATAFIDKYLRDVRPSVAVEPDDGTLFLAQRGGPLSVVNLSTLVGHYVALSGIGKSGGCHLFRHAMATLMLENGADIRYVQEMLGHVKLETTQIYTHVSIKKLKEIHTATHPTARLERPRAELVDDALLEAPEASGGDDVADGGKGRG